MAISKGMYADSNTAANVVVRERSDTDRAQDDDVIYMYQWPAPDRNYSRHRSTAVQERSDTDRAQHDYETYRYRRPAPDRNYSRHRSTGCLEAEERARADDVMTMLTHMARVTGMKAAYTHSRRGAAVAGPFIIFGGMLLGPVGIFIGGVLGGLVGWMASKDFKSVPQVLMELPAAERQKLCAEAMAVVKNLKWKDAAELIKFVTTSSIIRDKVLGVLATYVTKKLKAKLKYRM